MLDFFFHLCLFSASEKATQEGLVDIYDYLCCLFVFATITAVTRQVSKTYCSFFEKQKLSVMDSLKQYTY